MPVTRAQRSEEFDDEKRAPDQDMMGLPRLPDGTLRYAPDGTDRLIVSAFDHSASRELNLGSHLCSSIMTARASLSMR